MARPLLAVLAALFVAGCGNDRTPPPETQSPDAPKGTRVVKLTKAGVRFTAPFNWPDLQEQGLRAGGIQNKRATVAVWRYVRAEPLPATNVELGEVARLLVERVKKRDPTFVLKESRTRRRGGARAIELVGRQTAAGLPYGVRSSHIFFDGAEIVVDAFAPPEFFPRVDSSVFVPLLDSLKLSRP
jgi:hypothetical protein